MSDRIKQLKQAEKGAIVSIIAYTLLAILKLSVGSYASSKALSADGINNFTDTISSIAILIGLRLSQIPADSDHRYGHWKAENVASLITSLIMFIAGFQVIIGSFTQLMRHETESPEPIAAAVGIFSAVIMFAVYYYNKSLAKKHNSSSLSAVSKDNFSDALTSIGTAIAVFAATFNLGWLDLLTAFVIGLIIIKTAYDVFKESTFYLSDGFDLELLSQYKVAILKFDGIMDVSAIRARTLGANIFLDVTVKMRANLSVQESHEIVDAMEIQIKKQFDIFDIDVHVEPYEATLN
ncbi:cation diffusion facilitator family transporter [Vagococcus sp.]|uniref:cation diffusion facilitator family transporter n=1 Tax=Vagococcus sp. TaxID=1933889 RepID=UPI003F984A0E